VQLFESATPLTMNPCIHFVLRKAGLKASRSPRVHSLQVLVSVTVSVLNVYRISSAPWVGSTCKSYPGACEEASGYSERSASITSTLAARDAGRSDATTATVISRNAAITTGNAPGIFISAK
jgi:hypothetical protein